MPSTTQPAQRTVALSAVDVSEGFNPREDAEQADIARLAESIKAHGLIHPLVVTRVDRDGRLRLIDGERRYRACLQASLAEVPVIVRDTDEATEALDVALVANMQRVDLSPPEQAKAFQRLVDRGLTRKGVAACDQVAAALKQARAQARSDAQFTAATASREDTDGEQATAPAGESPEQAAEARRREREAQQEARRAAVAHNDELGSAIVKHFAKLKVDERVVKILAAVDFGGALDKIACRGGCCINPRRARWIVSKGGLRKRSSHPSRAGGPSRCRPAQPLWRPLPRARSDSSETALCNSHVAEE